MQTLFEHALITVWVHPRQGIVHHRIHAPIRAHDAGVLRQALTAGTRAMRDHHATKWLSEDQHFNVMPEEFEEWACSEWSPQTRDAGWRTWAIVKPESAVTRLYVQRLADTFAELGVTVRFFTECDEAMNWLQETNAAQPFPPSHPL